MSSDAPPAPLAQRIDALDEDLFSFIDIQSETPDWDSRSLLALHSATARSLGSFCYLEIGSFLGGSLQTVMRDPRCTHVISLDPRPPESSDNRGHSWIYAENTTANMLEHLARIPDVDVGKISTFDRGTDSLLVEHLPARPDYCFIDGEHTDHAVLRDARFCSEALGGTGVIAFHDYPIVGQAIRSFLRETWSDISYAVAFTGAVCAVELGGRGILRSEVVTRAVSSNWHSLTWRLASRPRTTAIPFLLAWSAMPKIDLALADSKQLARRMAQGPRSQPTRND